MFCKKCGNQLADNQRFCNRCGAPVTPTVPAAPPVPIPEKYHCPGCGAENPTRATFCAKCGRRLVLGDGFRPPRPPKGPKKPRVPKPPKPPRPPKTPADPATALVNGRFRSPLLLVCILLLAATLVLSLYGTNTVIDELWGEAEELVQQLDKTTAEQIDDWLDDYSTAITVSAIASRLPAILMLVCLCVCYIPALVHPRDAIPAVGLRILHVLALVLEILFIVLGASILVGSILLLLLSQSIQLTTETAILAGCVLLVITALIVLTVLYYAKASRTARRLCGYVGHSFSRPLPLYVPVMNYIVSGVEIVLGAGLIVLLKGASASIPVLLHAAYLFCLGVFISTFRQTVQQSGLN